MYVSICRPFRTQCIVCTDPGLRFAATWAISCRPFRPNTKNFSLSECRKRAGKEKGYLPIFSLILTVLGFEQTLTS